MKSEFSALLVHTNHDAFETLNAALEELSVEPAHAWSLQHVESSLCRIPPPHLVVTEPVFPEGNWWDVLDLAAKASEKVNVIVVSAVADIGLYVDVINHGGFDVIGHSLATHDLVHVLRGALEDAVRSRGARKRGPYVFQEEPSGQLTP